MSGWILLWASPFKTLACKWWWKYMYREALEYAKNCPQCAIVKATGRKQKPPLHPIPNSWCRYNGLPVTTRGNKYVMVFQDLFTKCPMVYPTSDEKAKRIACLLVEGIVPFFGIAEAQLSEVSHLTKGVCNF